MDIKIPKTLEEIKEFVIQFFVNDIGMVLGGKKPCVEKYDNPYNELSIYHKLKLIEELESKKPEYWLSIVYIIEDSINNDLGDNNEYR